MYPVLMAADILIFNAHEVPVGRDQIQHIEMARDIGQRFNHLYGSEYFTLPEAKIEESVATLPGTDGRKMSKSYDNTIPLWLPAKELRKAILGIVTDSRAPGEAKDADASNVFAIFQAFASPDESAAMRTAFADGIGWGDAKQALFERVDAELAPLRERYDALVARPEKIEELLHAGARKARARSVPLLSTLREAVGIRRLAKAASAAEAGGGATKTLADLPASRLPQVKSYREADGKFYFKLTAADGTVLLQSRAFDAPKDAGILGAALVDASDDATAVAALLRQGAPSDGSDASIAAIVSALVELKADKLAKERTKA
jgi:tryptophanyl-tRNA synthetase